MISVAIQYFIPLTGIYKVLAQAEVVFLRISLVNYQSIFVNNLEMKTLGKMVSPVHHDCACFLQCPGGAFTPNVRTTKEFPDDVVTFIRNHPLMFNPIYPIHKRPLIIRIGADYKYTKIAVDRVNAADGRYHVLFLGTGRTNLAAFISSVAINSVFYNL